MPEDILAGGSDETGSGKSGEEDGLREAYATFRAARDRHEAAKQGRGFYNNDQHHKGNGKNDERIERIKMNSLRSRCGRPGHWHRDPECPLNRKGNAAGDEKKNEANVVNVSYGRTGHSGRRGAIKTYGFGVADR
eukprot:9411147-Alexandrium_andersonii.AAC.1